MAKYKLKSSVIEVLKSRGIVKQNDTMTLQIPYVDDSTGVQTFYELTFAVTEAVETSNKIAMAVLDQKRLPKLLAGPAWMADESVNPWFERLPDDDATTSKVPDVDGTEVVTQEERKILRSYSLHSGVTVPDTQVKADVATHLADAATYFNS